MNKNESVAFLQWLEGVVEYYAPKDRFIFQGKSFKRKGQAQKAARKYWKEVYSEFFLSDGYHRRNCIRRPCTICID
ncbi:hypothetical protein O157vBn_00007 [Escherichia phage vB_Eco4M-7n]